MPPLQQRQEFDQQYQQCSQMDFRPQQSLPERLESIMLVSGCGFGVPTPGATPAKTHIYANQQLVFVGSQLSLQVAPNENKICPLRRSDIVVLQHF